MLAFTLFLCVTLAPSQDNRGTPPNELMRRVVSNELKAEAQDHSHWMFRQQTEKPGAQTEVDEVIESSSGDLSYPILINGQQLSAEPQKRADQHLRQRIHNPGALEKSRKAENEDAARTQRLLKMVLDAFVFSYAEQPGDLVHLNFKPNSRFHPSSREAQVFDAMEGSVWVDSKQLRLGKIAGHLIREVKFGGGMLGHLDKGGQFEVKQSQIAPGHWELTVLNVQMRGKALFFKTIGVQQKYSRSGFRLLADNLTLEQAAEILRQQAFNATKELAKRSPRRVVRDRLTLQ
jgi:hypothetical protein